MFSPLKSAFIPALADQTDSSRLMTKATDSEAGGRLASSVIWSAMMLITSAGKTVARSSSCWFTAFRSAKIP
jgi:hypothetical protein